ncbi:MAG TPA: hypothetical protein VFR88_05635 [Microlunatus sp.]|nr:hypothetical protein [Microlunatus sp.]
MFNQSVPDVLTSVLTDDMLLRAIDTDSAAARALPEGRSSDGL